MRYFVLLVLSIILLFNACVEHAITVPLNANNTVYCKGKDITEAEGKRLGQFLLAYNALNAAKKEAVQLSKEKGAYVVHFVLDEGAYKKDKAILQQGYSMVAAWISERVFNGTETKVVLADSLFNGYAHIETNGEVKRIIRMDNSLSIQ